jgi:hypothetical protein
LELVDICRPSETGYCAGGRPSHPILTPHTYWRGLLVCPAFSPRARRSRVRSLCTFPNRLTTQKEIPQNSGCIDEYREQWERNYKQMRLSDKDQSSREGRWNDTEGDVVISKLPHWMADVEL